MSEHQRQIIAEAAARLRQHNQSSDAIWNCTTERDIIETTRNAIRTSPYRDNERGLEVDRHVLADAYLAEHPASDADAITDERLEAMGFKDESLVLCDNENALTKLVMLWSYEDNYRHAAIYQRGKNGTPERVVSLPTPLRTLGDVRKLLEGLGYSVTKEPA